MTVKKLRYLAYALVAVAFCACQKEPSTSGLHKDYLVYTAYDTEADFGALDTYYLPDSILLIGAADKTEYWKDDNALAAFMRPATPAPMTRRRPMSDCN